MRTLGWNMLGELGQEIQRRKNLEIPLRPGRQAVALRIGKGPAGVLLRLIHDVPAGRHLDEPRKAERATSHVVHHPLEARAIARRQEH